MSRTAGEFWIARASLASLLFIFTQVCSGRYRKAGGARYSKLLCHRRPPGSDLHKREVGDSYTGLN